MKNVKDMMLLYAVTDRAWVGKYSLYEQVEQALEGGITCLQLREKNLDYDAFLKEAIELKKLCYKYDVPFIVNDNVQIALESDADGVHVGQSDMQACDVRKLIGYSKILGVSADNLEQAKAAVVNGADYIGLGAVFNTATKDDANNMGLENLRLITQSVDIANVAIGGIKLENIPLLKDCNIDGIAVVSAIFASNNITQATASLLKSVKAIVKK